MCTAITFNGVNHYFGRNLDLEYSYNETVTITPRNYVFSFRHHQNIKSHYAIIGMALVLENTPLYYDGANEMGLAIAGLNFPGNADYKDLKDDYDNIAPFELIPYVLATCKTVKEVKNLFKTINIININFNDQLPNAPLHWIVADKNQAITIECVQDGLKIYDNEVGVLTNNPTFDIHTFMLNQYMQLSNKQPEANLFNQLNHYCAGMGAIGLPGDMSSLSRFIRATFSKMNALPGQDENESVHQFFHILESVAFIKGCVYLDNGKYDQTVYSSCCNLDDGIYYYRTYNHSRIIGINMFKEDLDSNNLISYPLLKSDLFIQNE